MLIRFAVENYLSIRKRQELSLVASSALKDSPQGVVPLKEGGIDLLRVAGIYGANASGKTNVLKALDFMSRAVENSHIHWKPDGPIPRHPFLLDPESRKAPSIFSVDLIMGGTRYEYEFALDDKRVVYERLAAFPKARRQLWLEREGSHFHFGKGFSAENRRAIESLTRDNSLFLSAAAQNNHRQLLPIYTWFTRGVKFVHRRSLPIRIEASMEMAREERYRAPLVDLLKSADLGIFDITVKEKPWSAAEKRFMKDAMNLIVKGLGTSPMKLPEITRQASLVHRGSGGSPVSLPFEQESDGTECLFALGGDVIKCLAEGGILCVDELDRSLHPIIALQVVKLFMDSSSNRGNAQLIFNTQDTNLLSERLLRRDQIWFTEKNDDGATALYPLTDFQPRRNENLEIGYLQGRYGAIPYVNEPNVWGWADEAQTE